MANLPISFRSDSSAATTATISINGSVSRDGTKATIPFKVVVKTGSATSNGAASANNRTFNLYNAADVKLGGFVIKSSAAWNTNSTYTFTGSITTNLGHYRATTPSFYIKIEGGGTQSCLWTNRSYCTNFEISIPTGYVNPSITISGSVSKKTGETHTFTSTVSKGVPASYSYQWQYMPPGGTFENISWATGSTYTINTTNWHNGYQYRCVVNNGSDTWVYSGVSTLTVYYPPAISTQPASQNIKVNASATFTVSATAGNPSSTSYQWQVSTNSGGSYSNILGANSTSFTTSALTTVHHGYLYRCVISNAQYADIPSNAATVNMHWPPLVTTHPADQKIKAGDIATFSCAANAGNPNDMQYMWLQSTDGGSTWSSISGANSNSYSVKTNTSMDGYLFRCAVGNSIYPAYGLSSITNDAKLTVWTMPSPPTKIALLSEKASVDFMRYNITGQKHGLNNPIIGMQCYYRVKKNGEKTFGNKIDSGYIKIVVTSPLNTFIKHSFSHTSKNYSYGDTIVYSYQVVSEMGSDEAGYFEDLSEDCQALFGGIVRINVEGSWVKTIPYVRSDGNWKTAIPYGKSDGTWKVSG